MVRYILLLILLVGCASKRETTSVTELKKSDTLIIKEEKVIQPKGSYSLFLHEICDSITGKPKVVTQYITRGNDSIRLAIDANNTLKLTIDNREAVISDLRSEIERLNTELIKKETTEIVRYKVSRWAWITLLISVASILYLLNRFFKWIPFV